MCCSQSEEGFRFGVIQHSALVPNPVTLAAIYNFLNYIYLHIGGLSTTSARLNTCMQEELQVELCIANSETGWNKGG